MDEVKTNNILGRTLVILSETEDWLGRSMRDTGLVSVAAAYKKIPHYLKHIRRFNYHSPFSKDRWYGDWKENIAEYDTIILFDVFLASDMAEYIEEHAPSSRLIVYYYNPWYNNYYLSDEARKRCEIWSFDRKDCQEHGLKYNHQFYFRQNLNGKQEPFYFSDLFFIGRDKGRLTLLKTLKEKFQANNINAKIIVVPDRKKYTIEEQGFLQKETMPYEETLRYTANSNCLLEVVQEFQEGLTKRMMEAMFFEKRIITTNKNIRNYDFFDEKKIYVLGDDARDIYAFIQDKTAAIWPEKILRHYSFEDWLNNFSVNK